MGLPPALGADLWQLDAGAQGGHAQVCIVVPLAADAERAVDLTPLAASPLERVVGELERLRAAGQHAVNLAPWHRLGLELLDRGDLVPRPAPAVTSSNEIAALWSDA